jgi:hypothetical protein
VLWGFCLYAWFEGQLPESLHMYFRQPRCLDTTAIVVFFVPVRRTDPNYALSKALLILYVRSFLPAFFVFDLELIPWAEQTVLWAIVLVAGSYWSIKAPIVLRRRGGQLKRKPHSLRGRKDRESFMEPDEREARRKRREAMQRDPADYTPDTSDEVRFSLLPFYSSEYSCIALRQQDSNLVTMTMMRSLSKADARPAPAAGAALDATNVASWSNNGSAQATSAAWTAREVESRHHFIIVRPVFVALRSVRNIGT